MRRLRIIAGLLVMACLLALVILSPGKANAQSVLELDAIVVEGKIQRPQASYIIQRASLDFGMQAKRRSFINKIPETIESDIF